MPIQKKWSSATSENLSDVPDNIGVYEVGLDVGRHTTEIRYIGQGKVRSRIRAFIRKRPKTNRFRYIETNSKRRAKQLERKHLERFEEKHDELPRFNRRRG